MIRAVRSFTPSVVFALAGVLACGGAEEIDTAPSAEVAWGEEEGEGLAVDGEAAGLSGCSSWKTGTMTGYDNLTDDDSHPGHFYDYGNITKAFLKNVPVVAIHEDDWRSAQYRNIEIRYNGRVGRVQSWDLCADADCRGCCSRNKRTYANPGFLLDVERRTAKRLFGIDRAEESLFTRVEYRICAPFDPKPIARRFGARRPG